MPQNFCEITTLNVHVVPAKSTVEISQNLVAFSEYMNFTYFCFVTKFCKCFGDGFVQVTPGINDENILDHVDS